MLKDWESKSQLSSKQQSLVNDISALLTHPFEGSVESISISGGENERCRTSASGDFTVEAATVQQRGV